MFDFLKNILKPSNEGEIKKVRKIVDQINALEPKMQSLKDEELPAVTAEVPVELAAFEGSAEMGADGLMTADNSELTWHVNVPQAGLYNIRMDYLTVASRGIDIER